jgi:hypothetical protein
MASTAASRTVSSGSPSASSIAAPASFAASAASACTVAARTGAERDFMNSFNKGTNRAWPMRARIRMQVTTVPGASLPSRRSISATGFGR